ncbi:MULTISPECIES: hypothetical protein [Paraburkholderia]|uniref:hypothetical protein n=1 Tax=Paraburkholderia TaxID=1822464 RepID=UPI002254A9C2|nr:MULTISPECIES: hypothetical protein [Paraburkholderia]MCX4177698.1 hypothetical protein [Paraburkholderia madseniana]MDQ6465686.1 hypothetical protein [Paraburkholderia madseniana]
MAPSDLFDGDKTDCPRTRDWALWIWANFPGAQGLMWMSHYLHRALKRPCDFVL